MRRRECVAGLGAAALLPFAEPLVVLAQSQNRVPLIGLLSSEPLSSQARRIEALRTGLRERGYSLEDRNISFEIRTADGKYDLLPGLAAELVRLKVDVLVALGTKAAVAARGASATVPIVVPVFGDPVASGAVGSLSRPDANITGIASFDSQLAAKRVELLKEAIPRLRRVAVLNNPAQSSNDRLLKAVRATGDPLRLEVRPFGVRTAKDFATAVSAIVRARMEAVAISADTLFRANIAEIAPLAVKSRLPSSGPPEYADAGCLIGYGPIYADMHQRAAYFIDRILKGAKPADLPIEQPTKFELVINLRTAKALGLKIPQALLVRADRVIE